MKIAHFECTSGISGDMTLAALIDAGADFAVIQRGIQSLGIEGLQVQVHPVKRHGFRALHLQVEHVPEHKHRHLHHIVKLFETAQITASARELALRIFTRLGEAEAKVHGSTLEKVHFHEVGAIDSIVDILGTSIALDQLGISECTCSPVPTGRGTITIAHGLVSVPAPATAELLKGFPLAATEIEAELTTPTGAAILASTVKQPGRFPELTLESTGYGAGTKEFATQANVLRVLIGTAAATPAAGEWRVPPSVAWMLETNVDTLSGEAVGFVLEQLWKLSVLDVFVTPIQMKKNRPGVTLSVLCEAEHIAAVEAVLFLHAGTLGIRRQVVQRSVLPRRALEVSTPWGQVAGKVARLGQREVFSPEYEACKKLAEANGLSLADVVRAAEAGYAAQAPQPLRDGPL